MTTAHKARQFQQELMNARILFLFKLREARKGIFAVLLIIFALVTMNVIIALTGISLSGVDTGISAFNNHYFMDYSVLVLVFAPLIVAFVFWQEFHGKNSIYPQTSISRFMSVQALSLSLVFLALCVIVVAHLLIYGLFFLIASLGLSQSPLIMGYSFSFSYLAIGFFAALVFLVMVTTTISFAAYAVRTFKLFASVLLAGLPLFYILVPASWNEHSTGIEWARMQLEFVTLRFFDPATTGDFIIACLTVIGLMLIVGVTFKLLLPSDKGTAGKPWMLAIAFAPYVTLTLMMGLFLYVGFGMPFQPELAETVLPQEEIRQTIDVSQVSQDSPIVIVERSYHRETGEVADHVFLGLQTHIDSPFIAPWGGGGETTLTSDQAVMTFEPAKFQFASPALVELAQPQLIARLEGNTLYLEHSIQGEGDVIFMPIWSMMGRIMQNQLDANPLTLVEEK